jgi:hypothetical protein
MTATGIKKKISKYVDVADDKKLKRFILYLKAILKKTPQFNLQKTI